ncbi:COG3336 Predicted membrane protein [Candidatus Nanopelagicaceae bacterium]
MREGYSLSIMEMHNHQLSVWSSWQIAPEITLPLIFLTLLYLRKSNSTNRQRLSFLTGITTIFAVVVTPIGARAMDYFSLHMIQHITLMMISGPLLVIGTPSTFSPINRLFKLFTNPVISWVLYAALMIGVHLPGPHKFIMENPWAHTYLELPLYIALPYFFYFNLLDRKFKERRLSQALSVISLFLMMVPETLTGFFIYVSRGSLYNNMYTLNDQRRGGSLMWAGAMIIDAIWIALAVYHWIKSEERKSIDIDAEIAAEQRAAGV